MAGEFFVAVLIMWNPDIVQMFSNQYSSISISIVCCFVQLILWDAQVSAYWHRDSFGLIWSVLSAGVKLAGSYRESLKHLFNAINLNWNIFSIYSIIFRSLMISPLRINALYTLVQILKYKHFTNTYTYIHLYIVCRYMSVSEATYITLSTWKRIRHTYFKCILPRFRIGFGAKLRFQLE